MRVILHIGHSKAGSSTIQRFLIENQTALAAQGVAAAGLDFEFSNAEEIKRPPNFWLEEQAKDPENGRKAIQNALQSAEKAGVKTAIISAETLGKAQRAALFAGLSDHFDVKVLHYVRRQDAWIYAAWKQWQIKSGLNLEAWVEQCLKNTTPNYAAIWSGWTQKAVPEAAYEMVWLTEKALIGGDLLTDFCQRAGINGEDMPRPGRMNPGFDAALLEIFQRSPFLFEGPHDNQLYRYLENSLPEAAFVAGRMPYPLAKAVMDHFSEQNESLRQRFSPDLSAEDLFAVTPPEDETPDTDIDKIYRAMGYMLHLAARKR